MSWLSMVNGPRLDWESWREQVTAVIQGYNVGHARIRANVRYMHVNVYNVLESLIVDPRFQSLWTKLIMWQNRQ